MADDCAKFKITGAVLDKFVAQSGKFAKLRVETSINGKRAKHTIKVFDYDCVRIVDTCGNGEMITVEGSVGQEVLKDRAGQEVKVDGYSVWQTMLVALSIISATSVPTQRQTSNQRPQQRPAQRREAPPTDDPPVDDDQIPF